MSNQIFDRDDCVRERVPDQKADALARLNDAAAYARLHAPEVFAEWLKAQVSRGAPAEPMRQLVGTCDRCKVRAPLFLRPTGELREPYLCEACASQPSKGSE